MPSYVYVFKDGEKELGWIAGQDRNPEVVIVGCSDTYLKEKELSFPVRTGKQTIVFYQRIEDAKEIDWRVTDPRYARIGGYLD
jgi:hypothetical protein